MGSKLMVELLRRGKTGNEILKILDAVTTGKLGTEERQVVLESVNNNDELSF